MHEIALAELHGEFATVIDTQAAIASVEAVRRSA